MRARSLARVRCRIARTLKSDGNPTGLLGSLMDRWIPAHMRADANAGARRLDAAARAAVIARCAALMRHFGYPDATG